MDIKAKAPKIIAVIIAMIFSLLSLAFSYATGAAYGSPLAIGFFAMAVACGAVAGLILALLIAPWVGDKLAWGVFMPLTGVKAAPPEFPLIRAKIAKGEIEEAVSELKELLMEDPGNPYMVSLLSDVFMDKTHDYSNAISLLSDYLNRKDRSSEDVPFAMKLVDSYLELNSVEKAVQTLEDELKMKYTQKDLSILRKRLEGLRGN